MLVRQTRALKFAQLGRMRVSGGALTIGWFLVTLGSVASSFEAPDESGLSTAAIQNLRLACGAASLHRTLMKRAPICQY